MRIESLTFLRFVAAFVVLTLHFGGRTFLVKMGAPFFYSGSQMVTFFFSLSGFVMLIAHYNRENESVGRYYLLRVARIVPVYLLALAFLGLLVPFDDHPVALILSLFMLQAWVPPYPLSLNFPAWSVSVEAFFYLIFPLVLWFIKSREVKTAHAIIVAALVYLVTQVVLSIAIAKHPNAGIHSIAHSFIDFFPLSHLTSFLWGIAGGLLYVRNRALFNRGGVVPLVIFLAASTTVFYLLNNPDFLEGVIGYPLAYGSSFYALFFVVLILAFSASRNWITNMLSLPAFVFLGEISYSVYILQDPAHIVWTRLSESFELSPNASFFAYVVMLVILSSAVYRFFEKPAKRFVLHSATLVGEKLDLGRNIKRRDLPD